MSQTGYRGPPQQQPQMIRPPPPQRMQSEQRTPGGGLAYAVSFSFYSTLLSTSFR